MKCISCGNDADWLVKDLTKNEDEFFVCSRCLRSKYL